MHKRTHQSSPSLQQLLQQSQFQPIPAAPRSQGMRRIASAPGSLHDMALHDIALHDIALDVVHEIQIEAAMHVPAFVAGACMSADVFPADLLEPFEDRDLVAAAGSCLASPPDGECTRSATTYRIQADASGAMVLLEDDRQRRSIDAISKWLRVRDRRKAGR